MKTRIVTLALIALFIFSGTAIAQRGEGRREGRNFAERQEHVRENRQSGPSQNLTAEQLENMQKLRLESEKQVKPYQDQIRELRGRHQTLITAEKADIKAIESNLEKMAEVQLSMAKIRAKHHQELRAQLTEEQRLQFDKRRGMMVGREGNRPKRR
jgi:Spy/CpxP family protein refolding chaperone